MHVVVPTKDFLQMLSRLKPLKAIATTGFKFAVYTFEAYQDKLRVIVSDNAALSATTEIFAEVKEAGKASVNGAEFFQLVTKISPEGNAKVGSRSIEITSTPTKLTLITDSNYAGATKAIKQKRVFSLVNTHLNFNSNLRTGDSGVVFKLPGLYVADVFRILSRLVASYTSDICGLAGVLLRCRSQQMSFVVSDGYRVVSIFYPEPIHATDFDIIIPKLSCMTLQSLIQDGDELQVKASDYKALFTINSAGLTTSMTSVLIKSFYPSYDEVFREKGDYVTIDTKILLDNISNVRRSADDENYRLKLSFNSGVLTISNFQAGHSSFTNEGIPFSGNIKDGDIIVNGLLLETSLSILSSPNVRITIPPDEKPIVVDNLDNKLRVLVAMALANA